MSNTSFTQLQTYSTVLTDYYKSLTMFSTGGSYVPPAFEDSVGSIDYSQIVGDSNIGVFHSSSYVTGSLMDTANQMASVQREFGMRTKGKSAYYLDAATDYTRDQSSYQGQLGDYTNKYRATSPDQAPDT
jgi:hypothetical protein